MDQQQLEMAQQASEGGAGGAIAGIIVGVIYLAVVGLMVASMWKIFSKAGKPGWACLVPIYNSVVMLQVAGKPVWWLVLMFIPFVNFVVALLTVVGIAKNFGKGTGFALGMVFLSPIFFPMLAFGDAEYVGEDAGAAPGQMRRAA
jgi:uncharacterized membrane protein YhaH (DUF805 family)